MVTSTYNYLAENYKSQRPVRYSSHKTSELQKIYNTIVQISKQSPLYLLEISLERQTYALNVKDAAMSLYTLLENFARDDESSIFNKKKSISSNEDAVSATVISDNEPSLPTEFNLSNQFTFNKSLTVSLHAITDSPVHITYAPNADKIVNELNTITDGFNHLLSIASEHSTEQRRANKLIYELDSIIYHYMNDLESCGIIRNETGELSIDSFIALQAATDGTIKDLFTNPDKITSDLLDQTNQVTINPMDYLDQKICTYPNYVSHHYPNPYLTSVYSGMLFNYYC